jgi:hypothetical protein
MGILLLLIIAVAGIFGPKVLANLLWFLSVGILLSCVLHYSDYEGMWGSEHDNEMLVVGFIAFCYFFGFSKYKLYEWRIRDEEEAVRIADEQAREARVWAKEKARMKAEEEARMKAEEEARMKAEEEARMKAEEEARMKAEEEARMKEEREAARKAAAEERRRAAEAQKDLERNSYYYIENKNGSSVVYGPIDLENMLKLYKSNKISLLTRVKFGIESELKPLKEFKELTEGLEEFL